MTGYRLCQSAPRCWRIYSETIKSGTDGEFNTRLLDLLEQLLSSVPVLSLESLPEKSAVDCILSHLEGMT